jgi:hypothetical protein
MMTAPALVFIRGGGTFPPRSPTLCPSMEYLEFHRSNNARSERLGANATSPLSQGNTEETKRESHVPRV